MFVYIRITRPIPALELVTAERRAEEKGPKQPVFIANAPRPQHSSLLNGALVPSPLGAPQPPIYLCPHVLGMGWAGLLSNRRTRLLSWPRPWPQTQGQYPLEISTVPTPSPKPQASVASPFLLLHSKAGCMYGCGGHFGEQRRGRRKWGVDWQTPCVSGCGRRGLTTPLPRFLPGQPAGRRGFWNSCPLLPLPPPVSCGFPPRLVPSDHKWGFVFPRQRTYSLPQPGQGWSGLP